MNTASRPRGATWLSWLLLLLSIAGFAAIWVLLALYTGDQSGWMAVLGALDVAWMLRLGGWRPGPGRAALALLATASIAALANWGIIASHLGAAMGLLPWESALKLGALHAWTLAQLANDAGDFAWMALSLVVAVMGSRWPATPPAAS